MITINPLAVAGVLLMGIVAGWCFHGWAMWRLGYFWTSDLRCACGKPIGSPDENPIGIMVHERALYSDVICQSCKDINDRQAERAMEDAIPPLEPLKIDAEFENDSGSAGSSDVA